MSPATKMKVLLVSPKCRETFWGFKHALSFTFKKAANPPLGLVTVASMLPEKWEKKLVDMNVTSLKDKDIKWADIVFISAISVQEKSAEEVITMCKKADTKIVAGGPLFTAQYVKFSTVDHLILNEAEITLPQFLEDLRNGCAKHLYTTKEWANVNDTPVPLWKLVNMRKYSTMSIQYSRGCPFDCEFCDITTLYGRTPRTKTKTQIIAELESLHSQGWRGPVFFVDDNFIGNKIKLKNEILPAIASWLKKKRWPFSFFTQVSINLSDDEELMHLMMQAGFTSVFVGIESPNEESLAECNKFQNKNRNLVACVRKIQRFGMQVQGGFIVGFDSDPLSIFERQIQFIQKAGIVTAMVGVLTAFRGTKLYHNLEKNNRLLKETSGDNSESSLNFIPKMPRKTLLDGYRKIVTTIYSPDCYYERVRSFLKNYKLVRAEKFQLNYVVALPTVMMRIGVLGKERLEFWRLFFETMFRKPRLFPLAITFAIYGFHFRKFFEKSYY